MVQFDLAAVYASSFGAVLWIGFGVWLWIGFGVWLWVGSGVWWWDEGIGVCVLWLPWRCGRWSLCRVVVCVSLLSALRLYVVVREPLDEREEPMHLRSRGTAASANERERGRERESWSVVE